MDVIERDHLVRAFKAIAEPYDIPSAIVEGWAASQALDFQRWPKKQPGFPKNVAVTTRADNWKNYYGPVVIGNRQILSPHQHGKRRRPTKRERMHARRVTP